MERLRGELAAVREEVEKRLRDELAAARALAEDAQRRSDAERGRQGEAEAELRAQLEQSLAELAKLRAELAVLLGQKVSQRLPLLQSCFSPHLPARFLAVVHRSK